MPLPSVNMMPRTLTMSERRDKYPGKLSPAKILCISKNKEHVLQGIMNAMEVPGIPEPADGAWSFRTMKAADSVIGKAKRTQTMTFAPILGVVVTFSRAVATRSTTSSMHQAKTLANIPKIRSSSQVLSMPWACHHLHAVATGDVPSP